jgi:hypothetical protein
MASSLCTVTLVHGRYSTTSDSTSRVVRVLSLSLLNSLVRSPKLNVVYKSELRCGRGPGWVFVLPIKM